MGLFNFLRSGLSTKRPINYKRPAMRFKRSLEYRGYTIDIWLAYDEDGPSSFRFNFEAFIDGKLVTSSGAMSNDLVGFNSNFEEACKHRIDKLLSDDFPELAIILSMGFAVEK